ncbi:MAG: 4-hydroxy-tetrahydrodipicolinate reductase, partial [Chitinophagales bacterium]|nr:4-hydroxy-tetrahydrodipicolinate reductase [Chitinophagales bacterium]
MKVALIGYGKMGRAIEQIIEKQTTHQVVLKIDSRNAHLISPQYLQQADVA